MDPRFDKLFDTHCHLNDERYDEDRATLIDQIGEEMAGCICVGFNYTSSSEALKLAKKHPFIYAAAGIHPGYAAEAAEEDLAGIEALMAEEKVVALGEIGLDYHYEDTDKAIQQDWFVKQLDLCTRLGKPVIIHLRDAYEDMLDILRARRGSLPQGVMHCYSGSVEVAKEVIDMGFHISFAGAITFKNARKLPDAVKIVPDDRLLVETDSPYLTPTPHRGERNNPLYVEHIARKAAEFRGQSYEDLVRLTTANAHRLFGI